MKPTRKYIINKFKERKEIKKKQQNENKKITKKSILVNKEVKKESLLQIEEQYAIVTKR